MAPQVEINTCEGRRVATFQLNEDEDCLSLDTMDGTDYDPEDPAEQDPDFGRVRLTLSEANSLRDFLNANLPAFNPN